MPNVQKLKAKERLEAIDTELKDLVSKQETRLENLSKIPEGEGSEASRAAALAEVQDATRNISKVKDERSQLEALVEAEEIVESENRARLGQRAPKNARKTEEEKALQNWSWGQFVECALEDKWSGAEKEAREEGLKEAREMGRDVKGIPMPSAFVAVVGKGQDGRRTNLNVSTRDQSAGVAGEGGNLIETQLGNLVGALVPRTRILGMGVQFMSNLTGNLEWPRETNVIQGASVAEKVAAAERSIVFDKIAMAPIRIAAFSEFTRDLVHRGKQAINVLVPNRLNRGLGIEWDRQLIEGLGSGSNEILGVLNISGIGDVPIGTDGDVPLWTHFLKLEELIADANADVGEIRGLTNPKVRRKTKETQIFTGTSGDPIWSDDNEINSYPVEVTTQIPSDLTKGSGTALSAFIQGFWPGMMVGLWGTDVIVNPFSLDKEAMVRVSAHMWTDMDVEHPEYFAAIQDIVTV